MYFALIYSILTLTGAMVFIEDYIKRWNILLYLGVGIALVLLAAYRPAGMDNDYYTYVDYFTHYYDDKYEFTVEWSFRKLAEILTQFTKDPTSIFLIYATIGVGVKFIAMRKMSDMYFLPVCIYIGYYYILHDFTQIRAGAASAFMLLGIAYIAENKWKTLACYLTAAVFHYSALILLPTLLFTNAKFAKWEKFLWPGLIAFSYALYFAHWGLTSLPIPYLEEKFEMYDALTTVGFIDKANVWNVLLLLKITVFLYLLYFYDGPSRHVKAFPYIMRFWAWSIIAFVALTSLPVLSFRISELFGIVEVMAYPCVVYTIKPAWVPKMGLVVLGAFLLFMQAYINKILVVM